jgi:DNA-binding MarR family transcriptional regulator
MSTLAQGLVASTAGPDDRRTTLLSLMPAGGKAAPDRAGLEAPDRRQDP